MRETHWLKSPVRQGKNFQPGIHADVAILGTGLVGASIGYWLNRLKPDVNLLYIDFQPWQSASFRNAGQMLMGMGEHVPDVIQVWGESFAKDLYGFTQSSLDLAKKIILEEQIHCDWQVRGQVRLSFDSGEQEEIRASHRWLLDRGFSSHWVDRDMVTSLGYRDLGPGRYCPYAMEAHPVKLRNGLIGQVLRDSSRDYVSGVQVKALHGQQGSYRLQTEYGDIHCRKLFVCVNAFLKQILSNYETQQVTPYRGQITLSTPLQHPPASWLPMGANRGLIYSRYTEDGRLLLGGMRNKAKDGEIGQTHWETNAIVHEALTSFAEKHIVTNQKWQWDSQWSGLMGKTEDGLPLIGKIAGEDIVVAAGMNSYGFGFVQRFAHDAAHLMLGNHSCLHSFTHFLKDRNTNF